MSSDTPVIQVQERNDIDPVCPHCNKPLATIYCKRLLALLGVRFIYFCPHCHKTLGVSHRKGFWMG